MVEETPLKKLELPKALQNAIEDKLQAEQASQKMQFVLDKCGRAPSPRLPRRHTRPPIGGPLGSTKDIRHLG